MTTPTVLVEDRDGVRRITLDRPPVNALSADEYTALAGALTLPMAGQGTSSRVRMVLLRARGEIFSAGQDLTELRGLTGAETADYLERATRAVAAAARCPVPLLTALRGPAVGAGALLAAVSHHVVASEGAWLSFPEGRVGLEMGASLLGFLPPAVAWTAMATGERLSAPRLQALGAVADVVPPDAVDEVVEARLRELLALPDRTLRWLRDTADAEGRARAYETEVRDVAERLRSTP